MSEDVTDTLSAK